jgi:manganese efflux pump family protein
LVLFKVVAIALSLALDVFAVSIGVGVRGISTKMKVRIGLAFAAAEVSMTIIGALLGQALGHFLGDVAGYFGFTALVGLGIYMMFESRKISTETAKFDLGKGWGLFLASLSISLDSLGIGFSILYVGVPMPVSLIVIAIVSVIATGCGLVIGGRLGGFADRYAAFLGGLLLLVTGGAFIVLKALHLG